MKLSFSILTSLLAVLPCQAADAPAAKRNDAASEKLGMKLSLQCWTFNKLTFFETVDKAVGLGVKYLEMYPGQLLKPGSTERVGRNMNDEMIAEIKKKLADAGGLKVVAYGVDGVPTDEAGARKTFEWAKKMGRGAGDRNPAERGSRQALPRIPDQDGPAQPSPHLAA